MADELTDADIAMDSSSLYREETFTDRRVGTLQRLTPITASGATDTARPVLYVGQTQVLTPAGALPLSFEVAATSLDDAYRCRREIWPSAVALFTSRSTFRPALARSNFFSPSSRPCNRASQNGSSPFVRKTIRFKLSLPPCFDERLASPQP